MIQAEPHKIKNTGEAKSDIKFLKFLILFFIWSSHNMNIFNIYS